MLPLTKNELKFFIKLQRKKNRDEEKLFLIQGEKIVNEAINTCPEKIHTLLSSKPLELDDSIDQKHLSNKEMQRISTLKNAPDLMAVMKFLEWDVERTGWTMVLDDVKDPGNLGTLIRLAEWFGFKNVVCSENTVDVHNPKTVQSSMGSLMRVPVSYVDLIDFLTQEKRPVYKADLNGESLYESSFPKQGVLVLGSESHGISEDLSDLGQSIKIPGKGGAESLNVAVAGGIISSFIFRDITI